MRLLQWFKSRKSYLIVNTNGKLIDHPQHQIQYRNFLDATDEVLISIDGPEDVTDHHRGVGTFKNVIQTLDYLKSKKIKPTLSAVLTRKTLNLETLEFLKGLKVKYGASIGLSPVTEDGRINNKDFSLSNRPSPEQLTLMKDFVLARKQIFPEINSILLDYFIKPRAIQCKTMRFALYVDVDHQIYPCINVTGRKDAQLGDIDHYNSKFDQKVVCDKCSCTPLIVGNLLLQSKIPKPTYITTILSRYLRRPTH